MTQIIINYKFNLSSSLINNSKIKRYVKDMSFKIIFLDFF